jgi:hypothetical protein
VGLSRRLLRYAAGHPRPIVVTAPHGTRARLRVEADLAHRGWKPVDTPAAAGLLVICGVPEGILAQAAQAVWMDMPGPRARVELHGEFRPEQVAGALSGAVGHLADEQAQCLDAVERITTDRRMPDVAEPPGHHGSGTQVDDHSRHGDGTDHHGGAHGEHGGHAGLGSGSEKPGGRQGHQGHEAHGHGNGSEVGSGNGHHMGHGHHMGDPGGLKMAGRGPDRDGLTLDRLHLPLGPVLPDWPAGLIVRTVVQGDVVQEAQVEIARGSGEERFWDEPWLAALEDRHVTRGEALRRKAASHLDSLGRLLAVAGWGSAATQARRLRDRLLWGQPSDALLGDFIRFARRVRRSRVLRWMLRDLGVIDPSPELPRQVRGDVGARLERWLSETQAALNDLDDVSRLTDDEGPRGPVDERPSQALLAILPALLVGAELTAARLIVASLDPDLDQVQPVHETVHA